MIPCSRRRKTKQPFCKDNPKCYWDNKSCKKKPGMNNHTRKNKHNYHHRLHYDSNAKLNIIMHKLDNIERAIHNFTRKKSQAPNVMKYKHKRRNNTSVKTASPTNVASLLSQSNNNSVKTASPNAVNKLKKLMYD